VCHYLNTQKQTTQKQNGKNTEDLKSGSSGLGHLTEERRQPVDVSLDVRVKEDENLTGRRLGSSDTSAYQTFTPGLMNDLDLAVKVRREVVIQRLLTVFCATRARTHPPLSCQH